MYFVRLRSGLPLTTNISSMFKIGISCVVQNEDTSINTDIHSSSLITCNRCLDTLTRSIAFTISYYFFFFCDAIDNSFVIPKMIFINCRAKTNSKDRINLIIDRVSTFWSQRPSSLIISSTSTTVENIKIKLRIVP